MAVTKTKYVCSACNWSTLKWVGQCGGCGTWTPMVQSEAQTAPSVSRGFQPGSHRAGYTGRVGGSLVRLADVETQVVPRFSTGLSEFDQVLGGGFAPSMTILLAGDPGAGKSTLVLQAAAHAARSRRVIYFAGEESLQHIKDRALRLELPQEDLFMLAQTDVMSMADVIASEPTALVVVDSIQTAFHPEVEGTPGKVAQMSACTGFLNGIANQYGTTMVLIGHVTKGEAIAGPMTVKHIVSTTLLLSSTEDARYRILRAEKNRYGTASEIGIFAMTSTGMKAVDNPSAIFLSRAVHDAPGSIVTALWEGSRPLLVEVQALLVSTTMSNPRRVTIGLNDRRVAMLMAVLHRRGGIPVQDQEVYVNIVGGIEVEDADTSADLPILLASVSSLKDRPIGDDVMAFGEIGLSGEVRPCPNGMERLREAARLGIKRAIVPAANMPKTVIDGITIYPVFTLAQAIDRLDNM